MTVQVDSSNPLAPFDPLIGGEWHQEGNYQVLAWGVGRKTVTSRHYFLVDGEPQLVSEGFWFWHPNEQTIKGTFVAIEMPVELFEYTTKFEGNKMVSELKAFTSEGVDEHYIEEWRFNGADQYTFSLYADTPEGRQQALELTYVRQNGR